MVAPNGRSQQNTTENKQAQTGIHEPLTEEARYQAALAEARKETAEIKREALERVLRDLAVSFPSVAHLLDR